MNSHLPVSAVMSADVVKGPRTMAVIPIGTWWEFEHYRDGKLIDEWACKNVTTTQGRNSLLDIMFGGATQRTTWYMCIFSDNITPAITDTYAVPGYTEVNAKINEATRPAFVEAAASGGVMSNSANKATFTANDTFTAYGAALVSTTDAATNTKGDTAGANGVLFASAKFPTGKAMSATDVLVVTCTITLTDV